MRIVLNFWVSIISFVTSLFCYVTVLLRCVVFLFVNCRNLSYRKFLFPHNIELNDRITLSINQKVKRLTCSKTQYHIQGPLRYSIKRTANVNECWTNWKLVNTDRYDKKTTNTLTNDAYIKDYRKQHRFGNRFKFSRFFIHKFSPDVEDMPQKSTWSNYKC